MVSKFREKLSFWGVTAFVTFGGLAAAYDHFAGGSSAGSTSMALTAAEQADVDRIKGAGKLAGEMGHQLAANTWLTVRSDNFGENRKCAVHVKGNDEMHQGIKIVTHPKWNLIVQLDGGDDILWTQNMHGPSAGEIRVTLDGSSDAIKLATNYGDQQRGTTLSSSERKRLLSAKAATADAGTFAGVEAVNSYDLTNLPKAYRYAKAVCA